MNIYLASSWRNEFQPSVLALLREAGHLVYDFRNPKPGDTGFSWSSIDPDWKEWWPEQLREALQHPLAVDGHNLDQTAMEWANACVLLLPCGMSAHLEAGWCAGAGKPTAIFAPGGMREAELMYRTFGVGNRGVESFCTTKEELISWLVVRDLERVTRGPR